MIAEKVIKDILSDIRRIYESCKQQDNIQLGIDVNNFNYEFYSKDYHNILSVSCHSTRKYPDKDLYEKEVFDFANNFSSDIVLLESKVNAMLSKKYPRLNIIVNMSPAL